MSEGSTLMLPPALPLPEKKIKGASRQKRERKQLTSSDKPETPARYPVGTTIGTAAAAEHGEGSSNVFHVAAFHGTMDTFINAPRTEETLKLVNARDALGRTPMVIAVKKGFTHCVDAMINIGALVDFPDETTSFTPLMLAATLGQLAMCATLIRRGADIHESCANGPYKDMTPAQLAEGGKHYQVANLISNCGLAMMDDGKDGVILECTQLLAGEVPPPPPGLLPKDADGALEDKKDSSSVGEGLKNLFGFGKAKKKDASADTGGIASDTAPALKDAPRPKSVPNSSGKVVPLPPVPAASVEVLKEINAMRRLIRQEKFAAEEQDLEEQALQYEENERKLRRELEVAAARENRAERLAEEKVAEAESVRAILADVEAERDYLLRQLDEASALAAKCVEETAEAKEQYAVAKKHSDACQPTIDRLEKELRDMTAREATAVDLHKSVSAWRKKEQEQNAAERARAEKALDAANAKLPEMQEKVQELKQQLFQQKEEYRKEKEAAAAEINRREIAATKIQALYRGRKARRQRRLRTAGSDQTSTPSIWASEEELARIEAMRGTATWLESTGGNGKKKKGKKKEKTPQELAEEKEQAWENMRLKFEAERAAFRVQREAMRKSFAQERKARAEQVAAVRQQMRSMESFGEVARKMKYVDGMPPSDEEINEYMRYLRIDHPELRWLALEGITAPTPWGWTVHYEEGTMDQYHYHKATDTKTFEHPLDKHCRQTAVDFRDAVAAYTWAEQKAEASAAEIAAWKALEDAEITLEELGLQYDAAVTARKESAAALKEMKATVKKESDKTKKAALKETLAAMQMSDEKTQETVHAAEFARLQGELAVQDTRAAAETASAAYVQCQAGVQALPSGRRPDQILDPRLTDPEFENRKSQAFDTFSETLLRQRQRLHNLLYPDPEPEEQVHPQDDAIEPESEPEPATEHLSQQGSEVVTETEPLQPVAWRKVRLLVRPEHLELRPAELQALEAKLGQAAALQCTVGVANWAGAVATTAPFPLAHTEVQWSSSATESGHAEVPKLVDFAGKEGFECFGDELRLKGAPLSLKIDLSADDQMLAAQTGHSHEPGAPPPPPQKVIPSLGRCEVHLGGVGALLPPAEGVPWARKVDCELISSAETPSDRIAVATVSLAVEWLPEVDPPSY